MAYKLPLTVNDKATSKHITDGIYLKPLESGACELFVSDGLTKSEPVFLDHGSVGYVITRLQNHFNR